MEFDVGIIAAAASGASLLVLPRWRSKPAQERARALAALEGVGRLTELVAHLQQHRGMSGAWLAGDASFATRLPAKQAAVEDTLRSLLGDAEREEGERLPCFTAQDIEALRGRWRQLVETLKRLSPDESFQHHCRLLGTVLGWLAALGEARIAQAAGGLLPAAAVCKLVGDLPALAECLGQARALGSAVAARGRCAPVARVRLHFLVSRATELLTRAGQGAASGHARQPAEAFLQALRERVLLTESVGIDAAACFRLGTEAVDAVYAWLAQEREALERALRAPRGAVAVPAWPAQQARCRA